MAAFNRLGYIIVQRVSKYPNFEPPHGARYYHLMISLKITIVAKTLSRETEVFILVTKLKRGVTFGPIVVPHRLQTLFADVLMLEMGSDFNECLAAQS